MNIHQWIFPSKKNKYHPYILRPIGLGLFLIAFVATPLIYNVSTAKQMQVLGYATDISVDSLISLTNQERANNGLAGLNIDSQLNAAAQAKANDMMTKDYWAHVAPDGTTPWSFIYAAGYNYSFAGENLAMDFNTSAGVVAGWMGSPTHRANVLNSNYADVGFATLNGVLQGSETTLVVAMYGARVTSAPAPTAAPTPASAEPVQSSAPNAQAPVSTHEPIVAEPVPPVASTQQTPAKSPGAATNNSDMATTTQQPASEGEVKGLSTFLPVKMYKGLNWGQKASLVLLGLLALLFIMKHTIVWRAQKRGYRHIWLRAHPISQFAVLAAVAIVTMFTGVGAIL